MASPSTAIQRPDLGLALEEFDLEGSQEGFIGTKVFPVLPVQLKTANFSRLKLVNLLQTSDTSRAPGAAYSRGQGEFQQDNFACKEHGHEEVVDDSEKAIYSYTIDSEVIAAKRARDVVRRNLERRVAAQVFNTTTYTGAALTTAVAIPWSTFATAVPKDNVDAAVKKVMTNFGVLANAVILTWDDYKNARNCQSIKDLIKYSGKDDPKSVTPQMLAAIFDVDQVIVAGARYNSANEGQAATLSSVWTVGQSMVCRLAKTNDLREVCIGRTFSYEGDGGTIDGTFEMYREEKVRGDVVRVRMDTHEKTINAECGHLLTNL